MTLYDDPVGREEDSALSGRAWLVTFTDLVSLMLTFFVMVYGMSGFQPGEWERTVDALSQALNPERLERPTPPPAAMNMERSDSPMGADLNYLAALVDQAMARETALGAAVTNILDDRLVISLTGSDAFEDGATTLGPRGAKVAAVLAGVLRYADNALSVEGFPDRGFSSVGLPHGDWQLAMTRARAVADVLRQFRYERPIAVYGFTGYPGIGVRNGEDEPDVENARRVDIVVHAFEETGS